MKYLKSFENYVPSPLPKAVQIENEQTLMDKDIDKELSEEEQEELESEEDSKKVKKVA